MLCKIISSLEKCFLDEDIHQKSEYTKGSMLKNEVFHLGICYQLISPSPRGQGFYMTVSSPLADYIKLSRVQHVPVHMPTSRASLDSNYLRTKPGLYPDLLVPCALSQRLVVSDCLQSLFLEIDTQGLAEAGIYPVNVKFCTADGEIACAAEFELEIIDALLPPQTLINTQWFHCDCLQSYYGTESFDERH